MVHHCFLHKHKAGLLRVRFVCNDAKAEVINASVRK